MTGRARGRPDPLRDADALVFVHDLAEPTLSEEDTHHLLDVLRLRAGSEVVAADGQGRWRVTHLELVGATPTGRARANRDAPRALLRVDGETIPPTPRAPITVGFALPKGERAEWAVQKLTELGVDSILPLLADRSVVRLDPEGLRRRGERFRRIAREAAAQCRRPDLPDLPDPAPLAAVLADRDRGIALAEPGGGPLEEETTALLVGPEGGWSSEELGAGLATVGLGPTVLRAETAAVTAGALLALRRSGVLRSN